VPITQTASPAAVGFPIIRFLDTNGNGTGTKNAIGDYSVTPVPFFIMPPAGRVYIVTQFIVQVSDAGGFGQAVYASLANPLTNGLLIAAYRGSTLVLDLTDGIPVQYNDQFWHLSPRTELVAFAGGVNSLVCTFDSTDFGTAFSLNGSQGDKLQVTCRDNFTALVDQTFIVHGYYL
jgi:hypothetical protein